MAAKVKVKKESLPKEAVSKSGPITLPALTRGTFRAYIVGESPLIVHAWSQKALIEMLAKQMGQKLPRYPKSPGNDFLSSIYRCEDGDYAFPATGLKRSIVTACTSMNKEITKVAALQAFRVAAEQGYSQSAFAGFKTPMQLVRVYSPNAPQIREDAVRLNGSTADLRYRAEFWPWAMVVEIVFNNRVVTPATVAALVDTAGFAVGLGEWRQEKSGTYGAFRLADAVEQKMIDAWKKMPRKEPQLPDEAAFIDGLMAALREYGEADESAAPNALISAIVGRRNNGKQAQL